MNKTEIEKLYIAIHELYNAYIDGSCDEEKDHQKADNLLCDLIKALSTGADSEIVTQCLEIIEMFEELPKWYA